MTKPPDDQRRTLLTEKHFYAFYPPPTVDRRCTVVQKGGAGHVKDHVAVDNELWGDQSAVR